MKFIILKHVLLACGANHCWNFYYVHHADSRRCCSGTLLRRMALNKKRTGLGNGHGEIIVLL